MPEISKPSQFILAHEWKREMPLCDGVESQKKEREKLLDARRGAYKSIREL